MNLLYVFYRRGMKLFIEWNWSALVVGCMKNEQLWKMPSYLIICWCHYVGISKVHCAADEVLSLSRGDAGTGQPVRETWSCHFLVPLTSRLLLPSVLWVHDSLLCCRCSLQAPAEGKSQALGSRDGRRMEVPSVLESSWEPVCGPRSRCACQQPAEKSPAVEQGLAGF